MTRRRPNLSSIRSHWRAFPEPGPPENTHAGTHEDQSRSSQTIKSLRLSTNEVRRKRQKLRDEGGIVRKVWNDEIGEAGSNVANYLNGL